MTTPPAIEEFFGADSAAMRHDDSAVVEGSRSYLAAVASLLQGLHRSDARGHRINESHSDFVDRLVRRLFRLAEQRYFSDVAENPAVLTVLAVGGYARRELNLYSDVDLLFLYQPPLSEHVKAVAERVQCWLWDAGLTVGGATRTVAETIELARDDVTVFTSIMAPRHLAGSGVLFHQFVNEVRTDLTSEPNEFIANQLAALRERHRRHGDSLYLLQPNVKEGAGGLRDYHAAYWTLRAIQPGGGRIDDFLHVGLLTEEESQEYLAALDFLWTVRNEAHLLSKRKHDQLSFDLQEKIAESLGYGDEKGGDAQLAVELFMGDYYRHARSVQSYSMLAIEQCHARVRGQLGDRAVQEVDDGFRVVNGKLEIPHTSLLREKPIRLLSAFAVAQDYGVPLTHKALRLIRENLHYIDQDYRSDPEATAMFIRILNSERRVTRSLMAMNEVGLLGLFLPEWDHIVCRWQHVMYHTYTVDVHSIFLVEELRRLWQGRYEKEHPGLTNLVRSVEDRPALFLGCLLHDIGKGLDGDHATLGAERARSCATRLGLDPERVERIVFLVAQHLHMAHLAQSRDLSDPKLIVGFAQLMEDRMRVRDLYLLTFADIRASSSQAWTDWKGQLLRELFTRTSELMELGADAPSNAIELIERQVEERRAEAGAELEAMGVDPEASEQYFDMMPHRYFMAHGPDQIARHAVVVLKFDRGKPMSTAVRDMPGKFSEFILCAKDQHALYANVAGTLTAHNINILGSHVYTGRSGIALEVYRVSTPNGGEVAREQTWADIKESLGAILTGKIEARALLKQRGLPVGAKVPLAKTPASARIINDESDFYTIVEVRADDRLGLLHDLTRVIAGHGYEIYISKAATVLDQISDTFYLKDRNGKKLSDCAALEALRMELLRAVQRGAEGAGS